MFLPKKIAIGGLIVFAVLALILTLPNKTFATVYAPAGLMTSGDLLPAGATSTSLITGFTYTASAIPAGTSLKIQFSYDDTNNAPNRNWYDADGLKDSQSTYLLAGTHTIDLSGLAWNKAFFSYRVWFISNGSATPVLTSVTLNYLTGAITYPIGGVLTSVNLLPINSTSTIGSFVYGSSAIPAGTGLAIQFSSDNVNWYDAAGIFGGRSTLSVGTSSIDLSGLNWTWPKFYYRVWFSSDGSATPVFNSGSVSVTLLGGINENSYASLGLLTSANLLAGNPFLTANSVSYTASVIPAGTSLAIQFSNDGIYWYSATGALNVSTTLSAGTHSIDLSILGWQKFYFYYRVWFASNGTATPVLTFISLSASQPESQLISDQYSTSGSLISVNLISATSTVTLNSFTYHISSLPANTGISIQFSPDSNNWYSSTGVLNASSTLSVGTSSIDLSGLNWTNPQFYYKAIFSSDGTSTPVLDYASLNYSLVTLDMPLVVDKQGSQLATTTLPVSNLNLGGAFTFVKPSGGANVTSITLHQAGSLPGEDITHLKLWYKDADTCEVAKPSDATPFGTGSTTFTNGYSTTTGTLPVSASTTCLYITYDIPIDYTELLLGKSIDLEIANPVSDVIVDTGTVSPESKVNIHGATIIVPDNSTPPEDPNACTNGVISSLLSLRMTDPAKDPTVFYLKNCSVWEKDGVGNPYRLSNPGLKVLSLILTDMTGPHSNGTIRMQITMSNMEAGNATTFLNVTRSYGTTATVRVWGGE